MPAGQPIAVLKGWHDYGPVGLGSSRAHRILAENGNQYLAKGRRYSPFHRFVAANEFVAAQIAALIGVPTLDYCLIELKGDLFFATNWMSPTSYCPEATDALVRACANRDRLYDVLALDVFLCNVDRHHKNLVVRRVEGASYPPQHLLIANDFSHCLLPPGRVVAMLPALVESGVATYLRWDLFRDEIRDGERLARVVGGIAALSDDQLDGVIMALPDAFLDPAAREPIAAFLKARRDALGAVFARDRAIFPKLAAQGAARHEEPSGPVAPEWPRSGPINMNAGEKHHLPQGPEEQER